MLTNECCPQCGTEADSSRVRLVQDSCGHRKCRECLLNDETGCKSCSRSQFSPSPVYTDLTQVQGVHDTGSATENDNLNPVTHFADDESCTDPVGPSTLLDSSALKPREEPYSSACSADPVNVDGEEKEGRNDLVEVLESNEITSVRSKTVQSKKPPTFGLKEHIVFTPGNPPKYKCMRCEKSYDNRKAARYHNYCGAPNTEKPHTCNECGQGFVTTGHLSYHMKSHTGSLPFTCNTCGKGFKQQSKLNRHLKSHEDVSEKPFKCVLCDKAFTTKQILKEHALSHSNSNFVNCPICNKKLSSQSCLRKHKKLHSDPIHKCRDCGKKFPVKGSLEVHMKTHQREKKFKCKECPRAFKIHSDLKRHSAVHQDDGEWECSHCHLTFRRRDNLVRHLKNIHPEHPPVVSLKHGNDKDAVEKKDEEAIKVSKTKNHPSVSQAVSVIRPVPVIQKAEAALPSCSQSGSAAEWSTQDNRRYYTTPPLHTASADFCLDQNFHRESVVQYGSSSLETTRAVNSVKIRDDQSLSNVTHDMDHTRSDDQEDFIHQNNAVSRPHVIVAKTTCL